MRLGGRWTATRLVLVVAALLTLWFAHRRWQGVILDTQREVSRSFEFPGLDVPGWLLVVALYVLVGVLFGVAVWLPTKRPVYRWGRAALLGCFPAAVVVAFPFFGWPPRAPFGGFPGELGFFLLEQHHVAAVLFGFALASGLSDGGREELGSEGDRQPPTAAEGHGEDRG